MSNSGLFSFPFFVTDQAEQTTQVSMWLKKWTWTGSRTKKCEIRIWSVSDVCVCGGGPNVDNPHRDGDTVCREW